MSAAAPGAGARPVAGATPGAGSGNPGRTDAGSRFALTSVEQERLTSSLREAVKRARRSGEQTLASISLELPVEVDPTEVACTSRRPGEPWFVFEQPDHGRAALVGLGEAIRLQAGGPQRFERVTRRWRALSAAAVGEGAIAVGGFSFVADGGASPHWQGYEPASLIVPELVLSRRERAVRLTLTAPASPDDLPEELLAKLLARVAELEQRRLPLLDPAPAGRFQVASAMPPEHFESAVARAGELIGQGRMEKIVLAREVQVHAPRAYDPAAVLGVLREEFPSCFTFCVGRGEAAFVAASPELLVRREGHRVSTLALAGSTRRSADPAVDAHLGEQLLRDQSYREEHAIVARRIERMLRAHSVWVAAAPEPELVRIANIQHLATPIRAQSGITDGRARACGDDASDAGSGGRAARASGPTDPGARGPRPRLVRRPGRLDGRDRRRRVLRGAALRAAARVRCALLCGQRHRARLRAGGRAGRDGDQAAGAAAAANRLSTATSPPPALNAD